MSITFASLLKVCSNNSHYHTKTINDKTWKNTIFFLIYVFVNFSENKCFKCKIVQFWCMAIHSIYYTIMYFNSLHYNMAICFMFF